MSSHRSHHQHGHGAGPDHRLGLAAEHEVAHATEVIKSVSAQAKSLMEKYRAAPGWTKELEPKVRERYSALLQQKVSAESALAFAYQEVVVPTLTAQKVSEAVNTLQTKPQATTVATRSVSSPGKASRTSVRSLAAEAFAEAGA